MGLLVTLLVATPCSSRGAAEASETTGTDGEVLHLGVVGFYTPRLMFKKYQPFTDYLSRHSGDEWALVIKPTYEATVDALCAGEVDLAYLGPFSYVRAHEQCGAEAVVQLLTGGEPTYRSLVMVRDSSPVRTLDDLVGKRFAFGAELSTSSHLVPLSLLQAAGLPERDVHCSFFANHERAVQAVILGEVDACGVRDLVGQRYLERGLRILATSDPLPNFPLAVGPEATEELRRQVIHTLVELPRSSEAAARDLAGLDRELATGFVPVDHSAYDGIRDLARQVFGDDGWLGPAETLRCVASTRSTPGG